MLSGIVLDFGIIHTLVACQFVCHDGCMSEHDDSDDFIEDEGLEVRAFVVGDRERVWQHLTDVELLQTWWWPMFDDARYEWDAQPGGVYRVHSVTGGVAVSGEFTVVEPPTKLEFSWHWEGDDTESSVEIELSDANDGTVLSLRHTGIRFDDAESLTQGWEDLLTRLEERFDEDE